MTKKEKLFVTLSIIAFIFVVISGILSVCRFISGYTWVLKGNWDITLPPESRCLEVYSKDSGLSFHGDVIRYHIFSCKETEPIDNMFEWQSEEGETHYYDSYSDTVRVWLNEISVPSENRPDYENCIYWYQSKSGWDEIIILWDKSRKKLYIAEFFL